MGSSAPCPAFFRPSGLRSAPPPPREPRGGQKEAFHGLACPSHSTQGPATAQAPCLAAAQPWHLLVLPPARIPRAEGGWGQGVLP